MMLDGKKPVTAEVDGKILTAAFRRANPPLVWRFDLAQHSSFSLVLQGVEGHWQLGVRFADGAFQPVAGFVARDDADMALAAVQKALGARKNIALKIVGFVFVTITGLITLAVIAFFAVGFIARSQSIEQYTKAMATGADGFVQSADQALKPPAGEPAGPSLGLPKEGAPQSADDALKEPGR